MDTLPVTPARRAIGVLRLLAGALVLVVIALQAVGLQQVGALAPERYFAFFTIDTGLIAAAVLIAGGLRALRHARDTRALTTLAMAVVPYAIVTGIVYRLLTSDSPHTKLGMPWLDDALHVWLPLFLALDWFVLTWLVPGRARLGFSALVVAVVFPAGWVSFTLIRGAGDGYYPYAFLDPATAGASSVAAWVAGLVAFILAVATVCILATWIRTYERPRV